MNRVAGRTGSQTRAGGPFQGRQRKGRAAASCRGEQFIHDAVQANNGGGFAFVKVAQDSFTDVGAKFFPCVSFGDDGMSEGAGDEAAVGIVFGDLKHDFAHGYILAEIGLMAKGVVTRHFGDWGGYFGTPPPSPRLPPPPKAMAGRVGGTSGSIDYPPSLKLWRTGMADRIKLIGTSRSRPFYHVPRGVSRPSTIPFDPWLLGCLTETQNQKETSTHPTIHSSAANICIGQSQLLFSILHPLQFHLRFLRYLLLNPALGSSAQISG